MGLTGVFKHLAERKIASIKEAFQEQPERVDTNLPLNIKINTLVRIDETRFITNGGLSLVATPGPDTHIVVAAGKFQIGDLTIYRIYTENTKDRDNKCVLQIPVEDGTPSGITLYKTIDTVSPQSAEDWDEWLNAKNGLIGYKDINVPQDDKTVTYQRTWGDDKDYTEPVRFQQTVIFDPYGKNGMKIEHSAMLYQREIESTPPDTEYLFVSVEKTFDVNHNNTGADITLMAGMDLELPEVEVLA